MSSTPPLLLSLERHQGHPEVTLLLSPDELHELTGYARQADQLRVLRERGFHRAEIRRGRLVLERSHYEAVTRYTGAEDRKPRVKPPMVRA